LQDIDGAMVKPVPMVADFAPEAVAIAGIRG
jgi:hypothetical protein